MTPQKCAGPARDCDHGEALRSDQLGSSIGSLNTQPDNRPQGLDPGYVISRVVADLEDVRQCVERSKDSFDDAGDDDSVFLTNGEAAELVKRLGRSIAALCHVVSPDEHSLVVRSRAADISETEARQ
jgi:hypothetical protein